MKRDVRKVNSLIIKFDLTSSIFLEVQKSSLYMRLKVLKDFKVYDNEINSFYMKEKTIINATFLAHPKCIYAISFYPIWL